MTELRKLLDDLVEIALLAYQEDTDYYWELVDDAKYRIEQWVPTRTGDGLRVCGECGMNLSLDTM